jgi:hypothetical protein
MTKQTVSKTPAAKIEVIRDLKALSVAIGKNKTAHAKVDLQWQVCALSAIHAFADHGNVFYINEVYRSLGKGARHQAMTAYFLQFGGVKANVGENKDRTPFIKDADKKPNLTLAEQTMWFDMAPSQKPDETLDYLALIMKALKKQPKKGQDVAHGEVRAKVAAIVNEYAAANGMGEVVDDATPLSASEKMTAGLEGVGEASM